MTNNENIKGLILAGGKGTRLYPTTRLYNKHLIHVYDKPMILHAIECLKNSGITDIIISLSYIKPELFIEFLGDGKELGVTLTYTIHGEPKGISYAINQAKHLINDKFIVYLGDNAFETDLSPYIDKFKTSNLDCMILVKEHNNPERYGVLLTDNNKKIIKLYEKPNPPPSNFAVLGAYFFTQKFFENFNKITPSLRGEYEITDAINLCLPNVDYEIYKDKWFDLGTSTDIINYSKWRATQ